MQTNDDRDLELIELGTVTGDTAGGDDVIPEGLTGLVRSGITAE